MNTHIVHARVVWAILAMEAAVALPIVSLPAQGQARPGVLGPVLVVALLPMGFIAMRLWPDLRDPSWRMLVGIGAALVARAVVATPPELDSRSVASWIVAAIVPMALGLALWWRGSASTVIEMTALEVRTEFAVLAICLVGVLALMRPFLLQDPLLLVAAVVLFALGGVIANALARQDAAGAISVTGGRVLAIGTAVLPCFVAALLVGVLRPGLLGTFWELLSRAIELLLTPIGLFLAWLASLLPRPSIPQPGTLPPPPTMQPLPPPGNLNELADQGRLFATLILLVLVLLAAVLALVVVKLMLDHWLQPPTPDERSLEPELRAERTGGAGRDARDFLAWLWRWVVERFQGPHRGARSHGVGGTTAAADAWAAYRAMLEWAAANGVPRGPSETVHQLQTRIVERAPDASSAVDLLSTTYEEERYGAVRPSSEALRRAAQAVERLRDASRET
ncbi:MAG: DUF4129 domain-containing protein [Chloroflexi bacterium]|nr:DUF4129 domain-containing protein [Chloroflexota bacterium]